MALMVCEKCTTRYSVGAPACPQCGATDAHEEGAEQEPAPAKKAAARKAAD
jgi:uncharacterized OB-fold protein